MAEMPPVSAARSVSARIRSFYFAVKLRRFGAAVNSAEATLAAATTRAGEAVEAGPSGAAGKGVGRRSGITIRSFSCALECKLQTVECLMGALPLRCSVGGLPRLPLRWMRLVNLRARSFASMSSDR